jgi:dimethylargininase
VPSDELTNNLAVLRRPGRNFALGLTISKLAKPDFRRMMKQHQSYADLLRSLGLEVVLLDALDEYPDAYFVEDTAVVMPEVAIISRPGAATRRGEITEIEPVLARFRPLSHIHSPGTLDGGDVLLAGNQFFVGISDRTNDHGANQFGRLVTDHGYAWKPVLVSSGLHLKSSVNYAGKDTLLLTEEFASRPEFQDFDHIILPDEEREAANILYVNGLLVMPTGFPRTRELLLSLDQEILEIDVSEARKMDGGLTCMSLRL